jgi:two-component system phosphate regulon sensor histidine kinase PhoR
MMRGRGPGSRPNRGRRPPFWVSFAWICVVFGVLTLSLSVAFYLTGYLYGLLYLDPSPLVRQIVNTLLGLVLVGTIIGTSSNMARKRGWIPEMDVFGPIIAALGQIAKGDFSIRLENEFKENQMFNELANSVNNMAQELSQMEKMRQEFISDVSHEIQSPLTSIRGFARALRSDHLEPDERRHYLNVIETESERLSRLTENLLRLASLDSEHARFEPKPYRVDKQIRSLILACEPQWAEKQIEMDVSADETSLTADEDLLSQVWVNLIHNSIKFTPPGGKVCVSLRRENGHVMFTIHDTGIGIPEEDQPRIFERFYKADKSRQRALGGSGLGLSIAHRIVEMHHGRIGVESRPGEGATFNVSLPAG